MALPVIAATTLLLLYSSSFVFAEDSSFVNKPGKLFSGMTVHDFEPCYTESYIQFWGELSPGDGQLGNVADRKSVV